MSYKKVIRKVIKSIFGVDGISIFVKKQKKNFLKNIYTQKYTANDLVSKMVSLGMKKGSVVFIHSSMSEFYNYKGTANELISKIIDEIGEEGTLLMPAYPANKKLLFNKAENTDEVVFDTVNTPSGAGFLSETFRKFPEVKRSINLQHSVCAYGKDALAFVSEHHLSKDAWDVHSPYFKLTQTNGLIFSFGLDPYLRNVTLIHTTESYFRKEYKYFADFFGRSITYKFLDASGNQGEHTMIVPVKGGVRSAEVVKHYFDKQKFRRSKISNLQIEVIESDYMFARCKELVEMGISIYKLPEYSNYQKDNKFIKIDETKN